VWPRAESGAVSLSAAQLSMLLDNGARSIMQSVFSAALPQEEPDMRGSGRRRCAKNGLY
jgi:hypothetical protein